MDRMKEINEDVQVSKHGFPGAHKGPVHGIAAVKYETALSSLRRFTHILTNYFHFPLDLSKENQISDGRMRSPTCDTLATRTKQEVQGPFLISYTATSRQTILGVSCSSSFGRGNSPFGYKEFQTDFQTNLSASL